MCPGDLRRSARPARWRVLLMTSHPLDARDGADKHLAIEIAANVPGVDFTWYGRLGARRREPLSIAPPDHDGRDGTGGRGRHDVTGGRGRRVPIATPRGKPGPVSGAQALGWAYVLERQVDLLHAVITIGPSWGRFVRLRYRIPGAHRRPAIHTVPAITDLAALAGTPPLGPTVVLSRDTEATLRAAGFPDVRVIPPGIDLDRWPARPRPRRATPVVAFAGHYDRDGGLAETLAALAVLARDGRDMIALFLMRARPGQDGARQAGALMRRARAAGLREVVVRRRTADMAAALAEADLLVLPARRLSGRADIPLTVLEAMATGRPVILSDLPPAAALGDAVLRVPAGNVPATAAAVGALIDLPRRWDAMARTGRDVVEREFSAEVMAARYAALYAEVLDRDNDA